MPHFQGTPWLLALVVLLPACTTCNVFRSMRCGDDMARIECAWQCQDGRVELGLDVAPSGVYPTHHMFVVLSPADIESALSSASGPGVGAMAHCKLPRASLKNDSPLPRAMKEHQLLVLPIVRRRESYGQDPELKDLVPSADSELTIFDLSGKRSYFRSNEIAFAIARRSAAEAGERFALFTFEPDPATGWMAVCTTPITLPIALLCDAVRVCLIPFGVSRG